MSVFVKAKILKAKRSVQMSYFEKGQKKDVFIKKFVFQQLYTDLHVPWGKGNSYVCEYKIKPETKRFSAANIHMSHLPL